MVGVPSQPPGVTGKSLSGLGANSAQSPIGNPMPNTITPSSSFNTNEVFSNLVDLIEACNWMVRKLNQNTIAEPTKITLK